MTKQSRAVVLGALVGAILSGCVTDGRSSPATPDEAAFSTATARVDLAIDAANACVADYMKRFDSPSVTPGDVLDAALTECRSFFAAHRGALAAMTELKFAHTGADEALLRAEQEATRQAESFRRIVRETGLSILVRRRSGASPLLPPQDDGELSL